MAFWDSILGSAPREVFLAEQTNNEETSRSRLLPGNKLVIGIFTVSQPCQSGIGIQASASLVTDCSSIAQLW
jgi:hypothetical protein